MSIPFDLVDWRAVRDFYEDGHTREECRRQFDFSKRSWRRAVELGLISPRTAGTQVGPTSTRFQVELRLTQGMSYAQIADDLGIRKSTIAFHARRLGRPVDDRFARRYDWQAIQQAHDQGMRAMECCEHFGFSRATWSKAVATGRIKPRSHLIPFEKLLVKGRRTSRGHLKARLIAAGLKESRCEGCGLTDWRGAPIGLQLHHRNGDKTDNRLINLQILCPNCHAQTDTWGGRNGRRRPDGHVKVVPASEDGEVADAA
jgi:5-methylcytosine-specific restriction endonuclease McrA